MYLTLLKSVEQMWTFFSPFIYIAHTQSESVSSGPDMIVDIVVWKLALSIFSHVFIISFNLAAICCNQSTKNTQRKCDVFLSRNNVAVCTCYSRIFSLAESEFMEKHENIINSQNEKPVRFFTYCMKFYRCNEYVPVELFYLVWKKGTWLWIS